MQCFRLASVGLASGQVVRRVRGTGGGQWQGDYFEVDRPTTSSIAQQAVARESAAVAHER